MENNIQTELQEVFRKVFENDLLVITQQTTASDISGWDSLTHMTLINEIEQHFRMEFSFNEVSNFKKVGDITTIIGNKL